MKVVIHNALGGLIYEIEDYLVENKGWEEADYLTCDVSKKVMVGCYCDEEVINTP